MSETIRRSLPPGFVETPHPPVSDRVVSRVETTLIDRPFAETVRAVDATPLSRRHPAAAGLPGVVDTLPLTPNGFGPVGGRHLVFLTDGTTVVEQVLDNERSETAWRFRYVVWGYTTPAAKALRYGLGDFLYTAEGDRTRVTWTYSFELKPDVFPGVLGPGLGGFLLKLAFLNGPYGAWMRAGLAAIKAAVERG
ncbi:MAG: SRPBCC family protein [Phenylobacterium sp.]|uniref:SRPBCC family protein n=1 Tax=Phenylobacterium sp. TaxID=1871053 RepID=UPI001A4331C8|nr:SRPBCC family protein [Phenylobacterium sp.]MBL8769879.1 SRPBCC family protein [Phenylobacterium sp.]